MANIKKNLYNIALGNQGYILHGTPTKIARVMKQMPLFEERYASGDRGFGDFSYRWFWAQESFVGMRNKDWADDGYVQYTTNLNLSQVENIDPYMELQAVNKKVFSDTTYDYITASGVGIDNVLYIGLKGNTSNHPAVFYTSDGTTFTQATEFGGNVWDNEEQITSISPAGNTNILITADSGSRGSFVICSGGVASNETNKVTTDNSSGATYTCTAGRIWVYIPQFQTCYAFFDSGGIVYGMVRNASGTYDNAFGHPDFISDLTMEGGDFKYFNAISKFYILGTDASTHSKAKLYQWDGSAVVPTPIYTWTGYNAGQYKGSGKSLYEFKGKLYILLKNINTGRSEIWSLNSSNVITKEYISTANAESSYSALKTTFQYGFAEHNGLLYVAGAVTDGTYWWGGNDATTNGFAPLASVKLSGDSQYYLWGTSSSGTGNNLRLDKLESTTTSNYAYLETNPFNASLPNSDKLWLQLTVNFDTFTTGGEIVAQYDIGDGWTTLGTISYTDNGAINNYTFDFPANTTSKTIRIRFKIKGYSTIIHNFTVAYLPSVDAKFQWDLSVKLMDNLILLDGHTVESKKADTLRSVLKNDYFHKNIVAFQDIDYAETTLTDDPLTATATTINVSNTSAFPEQGRIRIDNEEILYTGKTATAFTGCTRGARGTTAVSHSVDSRVHNGYNVLISNYAEQTPIGTEAKIKESLVTLRLIEI